MKTLSSQVRATVSGLPRDAEAPRLIAEGLSASTEIKLPVDQRIAGLQEILHAEAERVGATVYRRNGG
ncbi:MAG: hypothetical protein J2P48_07080 [Alphaproteobacteria bacterium]|nr:hypothetical protein [Alphaproteobacteria bacterium]